MKKILIGIVIILILGATGYYFLHRKTVSESQPASTSAPVVTSPANQSSPSITLFSPNGGETLVFGQPYLISWKSVNVPSKVNVILNAYDQSGNFIQPAQYSNANLADAIDDRGSYTWTPSSSVASLFASVPAKYKISITPAGGSFSSDENYRGESKGYFTIAHSSNQPAEKQPYESGNDTNGTHIGYIKSVSTGSNAALSVDYIQFFLPCAAGDDCPNGFRITNTNSQLRTFPISPSAAIQLQTYSTDANQSFVPNQAISLSDFAQVISTGKPSYPASDPYIITIANGAVTKIVEQYIP